MKYLTLFAFISHANAVPVVGGITKEISCKDEVDINAGTKTYLIDDCTVTVDESRTDPYKCYQRKPIGAGGDSAAITAADYDDTADQCATIFDTEGGDRKCV